MFQRGLGGASRGGELRRIASVAWVCMLALAATGCMVRTDRKIAYGLSHYEMGLYNVAVGPLLEAADRIEDEDPTDPRLPAVLDALGHMAASMDRPDLAEGFFRRGVEKTARLDPPDDRETYRALTSFGDFLRVQERSAEAIPLLERARDISASWNDDRLGHAIALDNLSLAYADAGRWDDAMAASASACEVLDAMPPSADVTRTRSVVLYNRAANLAIQGEHEAADAEFRDAIQTFEQANAQQAREGWRLGVMLRRYAAFLRERGREADAERIEARREFDD